MDIFDTLTMLGGLALFLFGMSLMGQALERRAELFRNDRYGRRLCKLRTDDAAPVDQRHYGRKRRHDRDGVAFESRRH